MASNIRIFQGTLLEEPLALTECIEIKIFDENGMYWFTNVIGIDPNGVKASAPTINEVTFNNINEW